MHENLLHITGESRFVYDMDTELTCLYGKGLFSTIAKGRITRLDTSAARALEGVRCVLTAKDIPGRNDASGFEGDEPCLVEEQVQFYGDTIALVAATSLEIAAAAVRLIEVEYEEQTPVLTIDEAIAAKSYLYPSPCELQRGEPDRELERADYSIEGVVETPAQEHWYLETQCSVATPLEDGEMELCTSTQSPSDVQEVVARVLGRMANQITVKVRRLGGGFGGKETWANKPAAWAALLANATGERVYMRLDRVEDQTISCKRHAYKIWYKAAFDCDGRLRALIYDAYSNGGYSRDLSLSIIQRSLFHAENTYYIPHIRFRGCCCRTNLLTFGAFRGFGAPQSIAAIEQVMDRIAATTGLDAWDVRRVNLFGSDPTQPNHYAYYGQPCLVNRLHDVEQMLRQSSDYDARRRAVEHFNASHQVLRRGIGITPVKFGIAFTNIPFNQGGALMNIYKDGSVQVNHGGVDMGQGITAKMRRIAARELGVTEDRVKVMTTATDKVPNTSPTAASTGTDLNGMAIVAAATQLRERLAVRAAGLLGCEAADVCFSQNQVWCVAREDHRLAFGEVVLAAYLSRIGLSSVGYYKTPDIHIDPTTLKGAPFAYYVYGMAVSEVEVNRLTGDMQILRADILHDVGKSLDPEIDRGQIEGAYLQGAGWLTMEDLVWNAKGRLLNTSPDNYKIPTLQDAPLDFRVTLLEDMGNPYAVHQSKALGEPPFLYGISVLLALNNALKEQ